MADEVLKGLNDFTLKQQSKVYRIESGWSVSKVYEGPQALQDTFLNILLIGGATELNISTGVPCVITASFPLSPSGYNEDVKAKDEAVWELVGEVVEKRLQSHGKFNKVAGSNAVLALIDKDISDGTIADKTTGALAKDWDTLYPGMGEFNQYAKLRCLGTDSYQETAWRVRMSMTV